jgi:hypothetical protein
MNTADWTRECTAVFTNHALSAFSAGEIGRIYLGGGGHMRKRRIRVNTAIKNNERNEKR